MKDNISFTKPECDDLIHPRTDNILGILNLDSFLLLSEVVTNLDNIDVNDDFFIFISQCNLVIEQMVKLL